MSSCRSQGGAAAQGRLTGATTLLSRPPGAVRLHPRRHPGGVSVRRHSRPGRPAALRLLRDEPAGAADQLQPDQGGVQGEATPTYAQPIRQRDRRNALSHCLNSGSGTFAGRQNAVRSFVLISFSNARLCFWSSDFSIPEYFSIQCYCLLLRLNFIGKTPLVTGNVTIRCNCSTFSSQNIFTGGFFLRMWSSCSTEGVHWGRSRFR